MLRRFETIWRQGSVHNFICWTSNHSYLLEAINQLFYYHRTQQNPNEAVNNISKAGLLSFSSTGFVIDWLLTLTEEHDTRYNSIIETWHSVFNIKIYWPIILQNLFVQMDNCTRENKTQFVSGYLKNVVFWGMIIEVVIYFIPVEHSHEDTGLAFSNTLECLRSCKVKPLGKLLFKIMWSIQQSGHCLPVASDFKRFWHLWKMRMLPDCEKLLSL